MLRKKKERREGGKKTGRQGEKGRKTTSLYETILYKLYLTFKNTFLNVIEHNFFMLVSIKSFYKDSTLSTIFFWWILWVSFLIRWLWTRTLVSHAVAFKVTNKGPRFLYQTENSTSEQVIMTKNVEKYEGVTFSLIYHVVTHKILKDVMSNHRLIGISSTLWIKRSSILNLFFIKTVS